MRHAPSLTLTMPTNEPPRTKKLSMRSSLWRRMEEAVEGQEQGSLFTQLLPALAVHLGSLSVGLGAAFPTILPHHLHLPQLHHLPHPHLERNASEPVHHMEPVVVATTVHLAGAAAGALLIAMVGSTLGRKAALVAATLPDMLGWLLVAGTALAPPAMAAPLLLAGRALTGVAAASHLSLAQVYVAETVQTEHRGWMAGLAVPIASIGVMAMYVLGSWLAWHHVAAACLLPPALLAVLLCFMVDTPHSLLLRGREKEAHAAMEQLRGGDTSAIQELHLIQGSVETAVQGGLCAKLVLLATQRKYYSPLLILNFLIVLTLLTGVATMNLYANQLFQLAGGHMSFYLSNIIIGLIQLAGSCLFLPLVKAYSRKQLLSSSALVMCASLATLGLYLYSQTRYEQFFLAVSRSDWLAILSFSSFLLAAPTGLVSIPLLYTAELFPTELRCLLSGCTIAFTSIAILVARLLFPYLEAALQPHGLLWVSAASCIATILFTLSCIPETRHKDLATIPDKFEAWRKEARVSPWVTPAGTPSHSRATTPHREIKKLDMKTQMFTK